MAISYVDFDAGADGNTGLTWALAKLTLQAGITAAGVGGTCFVRRTNVGTARTDTADVAARDLTSLGVIGNPVRVFGCKDATTAEPPVKANLAVRGTDTLPVFSAGPTSTNDIFFNDITEYSGINFIVPAAGQFRSKIVGESVVLIDCESNCGALWGTNAGGEMYLHNCAITLMDTGAQIKAAGPLAFYNCDFIFTAQPTGVNAFVEVTGYSLILDSCDYSGLTEPFLLDSGAADISINNCTVPTTPNYMLSADDVLTETTGTFKVVNSTNATAIANGSSVQQYFSSTYYGTITLQNTITRTGGANDNATGLYALSMKVGSDRTLEGSRLCNLSSSKLSVWVTPADTTLTVYIANSTASTDYLEDEVWCEFSVPDAGDTARYDTTTVPTNYMLPSATIVEDDTVSTWATGGNNAQKFTLTIAAGYEGWAHATVHLAKRQTVQDTLYLDPKIVVT